MSDNSKKSFSLRAFASVFAGLSFVLMVVTGLVLFIAPSCRVADDTSWAVLGHDKDQWVAVHVWLSAAFVIASVIHIYLNWKVLISYFKSRVRKNWALRTEWLAALAICAVLYAGSAAEVPPFSSLMAWKETFKHPEGGSGPGRGSGRGRGAGRQLQNLDDHAEHQNMDDEHGATKLSETSEHGSGRVGGGIGRMTLRQFCSDRGIELTRAISQLKSQGLTAGETMTMREIADSLGMHPRELRVFLQPMQ